MKRCTLLKDESTPVLHDSEEGEDTGEDDTLDGSKLDDWDWLVDGIYRLKK